MCVTCIYWISKWLLFLFINAFTYGYVLFKYSSCNMTLKYLIIIFTIIIQYLIDNYMYTAGT